MGAHSGVRGGVAAAAAAVAIAGAITVPAVLGAGQAEAAVVTGRISNAAGGCLENANNATTEGNTIQLQSCGTNTGQQWSRWSDGTLRVQGKCADLKGGATAVDTAVVLTTCSTSTSQRWTVRSDGRLLNQKANRCLQPYRAMIRARMPATIAACSTSNAQRWTVPALSTTPAPTTTVRPTTTTPRPTTTTPPVTTAPTTTPPGTTSPTTTTTTTTTTPPAGTRSWDSAFTTAGMSRFASTPWNNVGAQAPVLVASPTRPGEKALQFTVPGGGERSEVVPDVPMFAEGADLWFGMSFTLPADFPTQVQSWQLITQWKNDGTGSPPMEITVGKGNLWLSGGWGHPTGPKYFAVPLSAADTGKRIDLVVHVVFSRDPAKGVVDVWRDGAPVLTGYRPAGGTLYPGTTAGTSLSSYWKMGLYRDPKIVENARYVIESARIGSGYGAVATP